MNRKIINCRCSGKPHCRFRVTDEIAINAKAIRFLSITLLLKRSIIQFSGLFM